MQPRVPQLSVRSTKQSPGPALAAPTTQAVQAPTVQTPSSAPGVESAVSAPKIEATTVTIRAECLGAGSADPGGHVAEGDRSADHGGGDHGAVGHRAVRHVARGRLPDLQLPALRLPKLP